MSQQSLNYQAGVVEGFYGQPWSWEVRRAWLPFLREEGFSAYLYAPKADPHLRDRWREDWPRAERSRLEKHRQACREEGICWGLGLSPLGWQGEDIQKALQKRCRQLLGLQPDLFWLLFDDMPATENAAQKQAKLSGMVLDTFDEIKTITICPTWYSYDSILEKIYGVMPADYLHLLGRLLPEEAGVLWTGKEVCAREQPTSHLAEMAEILGRKPTLWDNFPVNDGHPELLHLAPFSGRPADLERWTAGYFANPMNQGMLSRLPLATLATLRRLGSAYQPGAAWQEALQRLCSPPLAALLERDASRFREQGREDIKAEERRALEREYRQLQEPAATEVADWLAAAGAGPGPAMPGGGA